MTEYIEQFWRAATPEDAIKEPPMVARFRQDDESWVHTATLLGYDRARLFKWSCSLCFDGNEATRCFRHCEVYDEPDWHKNQPEPGEGYRLLQKLPEPEELLETDECYYPRGTWSPTNQHKIGQAEHLWYRRKIEPAAVQENTGNANQSILCPFVRLGEREGLFFPLSGGELIQIGDVYHHERDATYICDIADGLSYAGLHVREVDACLKFYRPVQADECKPAAVTEAKAEPIMVEPAASVDEPVKLVAHPIQLDDSGVWRFKSTPIQDRSYAVLNNRGYYLQWLAGKRPEYQPEFRHAFTPARLLQVSIRELGRNIRLRAVEPVDADTLKQEVRQELQPRAVEPTPTYEPGKVYEHNGRKFRLATKGDIGKEVLRSDYSLEQSFHLPKIKLEAIISSNGKLQYAARGYWKYAFVEITEPPQEGGYKVGQVYEYDGRKFRLATSKDIGIGCYCSNQSLEAAVKAERLKTLSEHKQVSLQYYVNNGDEHWKWAFIEITEPQQQQPEYVPFKWQDRHLLRNRYVRLKIEKHRECQIVELDLWDDGTFYVRLMGCAVSADDLFHDFVFADDNDMPCGKRVDNSDTP